jgi:septum formation protein
MKLILASSSVSRFNLLKKFNFEPILVISPDINEDRLKNEKPLNLVKRLAKSKLIKAIELLKLKSLDLMSNCYILSADTIVYINNKVLDKTDDDKIIEEYLKLLSNKSHKVITSFCLYNPNLKNICQKTIETKVKFKKLSQKEIEEYIKSKEGIGKAGGYSISEQGEKFAIKINGSYSNIIGLPMQEIIKLLI